MTIDYTKDKSFDNDTYKFGLVRFVSYQTENNLEGMVYVAKVSAKKAPLMNGIKSQKADIQKILFELKYDSGLDKYVTENSYFFVKGKALNTVTRDNVSKLLDQYNKDRQFVDSIRPRGDILDATLKIPIEELLRGEFKTEIYDYTKRRIEYAFDRMNNLAEIVKVNTISNQDFGRHMQTMPEAKKEIIKEIGEYKFAKF